MGVMLTHKGHIKGTGIKGPLYACPLYLLIRPIALLFLFLLVSSGVYAATVRMRIVIVNPSATKTQTKSVKNYLPREITQKDILETDGLEIDYDDAQAMFYVYKNEISLTPSETKSFEIVLNDVWTLPEKSLGDYGRRTEAALGKLKGSPYFSQAQEISNSVRVRIDEILKTQNDSAVTKQQHIAYYRGNLQVLEAVKADIEKLEKIIFAVGGPPNLELIEESDISLKSPSSKTTWIIIFIILIFVAILSATFYFTWMHQAKLTDNIFMKEKDSSFAEFRKGKQEEPK